MALSKARIGEIAAIILQSKLEGEGGIHLNPEGIRRDVLNTSKKLGIPPSEGAEFAKISITAAYEKTIAILDGIIIGPQ